MRRSLLAAVLLAAGCVPDQRPNRMSADRPPPTPREIDEQRKIAEGFEKWNAATAAGDVEATYRGMTGAFKSNWMLLRLRDPNDMVTKAFVARLDADSRLLLDKWFEAHQKHLRERERPVRLPETILGSQWLFELYREHFSRSKVEMVAQAKARTITDVYVDGDGVTIVTNTMGRSEMYMLSFEGDGWRVDGYLEARMRKP